MERKQELFWEMQLPVMLSLILKIPNVEPQSEQIEYWTKVSREGYWGKRIMYQKRQSKPNAWIRATSKRISDSCRMRVQAYTQQEWHYSARWLTKVSYNFQTSCPTGGHLTLTYDFLISCGWTSIYIYIAQKYHMFWCLNSVVFPAAPRHTELLFQLSL